MVPGLSVHLQRRDCFHRCILVRWMGVSPYALAFFIQTERCRHADIGLGRPGRDTVDPYVRRKFVGELSHYSEGSVLACDVHDSAAIRIERRVRQRHDDGAIGLQQLGKHHSAADDDRHDIEIEYLLIDLRHVLRGNVHQLAKGIAETRIGQKHIDPAKGSDRFFHRALIAVQGRNVGLDSMDFVAVERLEFVEPLLHDIDYRNPRTFFDVAVHDRTSYSRASACDQCDLAV